MLIADYFQVIHDKARNEWRVHVSDSVTPPQLAPARRFHEGRGSVGLRSAVRCYRAVATTVGAGFKVVHHLPDGHLITEVFDDAEFDRSTAVLAGAGCCGSDCLSN
jgi:hypothetical protein